ncbi:MAG TPA: PAS domain-containing sensor histidine kinase [Noviherbaspirillum sp.]|jgi:PAS domain S-box-containing protein|uniref:sensor histidine kinase n=1 Tax=Noviherbaspirillum sp. TaxID=1926288 RepID=UPI002F931230
MTTYLENSTGRFSSPLTTLPRFPANKVGSSLLSMMHSATDGVIIVDGRRHIVLVNEKAERLFDYTAAQLLDKPLDVLVRTRIDLSEVQSRKASGMSAPDRVGCRQALKGVRSDGVVLSLNASVSRLSVRGESFLALVVHDDAPCRSKEQKQRPVRPAELRRWAASSQRATEIEKRRFSKKLYDDIGQRLSVLKLDLDWLENSLPEESGGVPARVAEMQGLLDNVIAMTKNMASTLRPPLLDDFGLLPAVEWMAENFRKKTGIACLVESAGPTEKLDEIVESAVFRVIQEGLSNIEKHSRARNVRLTLQRTVDSLCVGIQDDGIGMAEGSENKAGCYGLIAMQERIFVLGGTISIRNEAPYGVTIHASIPIELSPEQLK